MRLKLLLLSLLLLAAPAQAGEVKKLALKDAAEVWYVQNDMLPIVDILLTFEGAGSAGDPSGKEGRAALATAMLTEGTQQQDALSFATSLEERAISLDISISEDRMTVHLSLLRDQAKEAGRLLAEALLTPRFAEEDLTRVKSATMTRLSLLDESPGYLAGLLFDAHAFPGHPYANPAYGTKQSVTALTEADLRAYLSSSLSRGNMFITAAGDVDEALLASVLRPLVDGLPAHANPPTVPKVTMQGGGQLFHDTRALPQSTVIFGAPGIERSDKRFYAAYLLNHVLGGPTLTSRFSDRIRIKQGLVYGVESGLNVKRGSSILLGQLATATSTTEQAIEGVKTTLKEVQDKGVTPTECEEARTYVLGSYPLDLDGNDNLSAALLAMRIHGLGEDYLEKRADYFKQVSCDEVNALARELLAPEQFLFVTVGEATPAKDVP